MARRECSYQRLFYNVVCCLFFLTTHVWPFCSCAVEICPPCGQREFCKAFLGMCLSCDDYCTTTACLKEHEECYQNRMPKSTIQPTTRIPTSTPTITNFHSVTSSTPTDATAFVVNSSDKTDTHSGGEGHNTSFPAEYIELSEGLLFGLFIALTIIAILGWFCIKHHKTLKMSSKRCFEGRYSQTSIDTELTERHSRNRRPSSETGWNIWPNPMENPTPVRPPTATGHPDLQVEDEEGTRVINQPGSSGVKVSRSQRHRAVAASSAHPEHSAAGVRSTPAAPVEADPLFQSASIHPTNAQPLEHERLLRAIPADYQLQKQKTPETHRKITDGTLEGHECTTGASSFILPQNMREDLQLNHVPGHGD